MEKTAAFEVGFINGIEKVAKEEMSGKKKALIAGGSLAAAGGGSYAGLRALGGGSARSGVDVIKASVEKHGLRGLLPGNISLTRALGGFVKRKP